MTDAHLAAAATLLQEVRAWLPEGDALTMRIDKFFQEIELSCCATEAAPSAPGSSGAERSTATAG